MASFAGTCDCLVTSKQRWDELFKLIYPNKPVPDIVSLQDPWPVAQTGQVDADVRQQRVRRADREAPAPSQIDSHWTFVGGGGPSDNESQLPLGPFDDLMNWTPPAVEVSQDVQVLPSQPRANMQASPASLDSVQNQTALQMQLENERSRANDCTLVLRQVWQALENTGSAEAMPGSLTYDLMMRLAPGVLHL